MQTPTVDCNLCAQQCGVPNAQPLMAYGGDSSESNSLDGGYTPEYNYNINYTNPYGNAPPMNYNPYPNVNQTTNNDETKLDISQVLKDPQIKKLIDRLETHIMDHILSPDKIKGDLNSNLQKNIKEELKYRIMVDMKKEIQKKMAEYVTQVIASKIPEDEDKKHDAGSIYQDTVSPFFRPGIVLP